MYRVIVNGNEFKNIDLIISQIKNLKRALPDAIVEVVFTRSAVKALLKNYEKKETIKEIIDSGVKINACMNSVKGMKLTLNDVATCIGVGVVETGVEEIVKKQAEGYSYLQL